jgi:hypothetical protein
MKYELLHISSAVAKQHKALSQDSLEGARGEATSVILCAVAQMETWLSG